MKCVIFTFILFICFTLSHAEEVTKTLAPIQQDTDLTSTLNNSALEFTEKRRSISPPRIDEKQKVLDFNGNERFATPQPIKPKPMGEITHTTPNKPRPIFDLRRKEDVDTVY